MENNHHNVQEKVLEKITAGTVTMRSPAHFMLRSTLFVLLILAAFVISTILINFIVLGIESNSHDALLRFGPSGWLAFLKFFPWPLLFIDVLFIVVLMRMLRTLRAGYALPVLYLGGLLLCAVILFGIAIERHTLFNEHIVRGVEEERLPSPFIRILRGMHIPPPPDESICMCKVVRVVDEGTFTAFDLRTEKVRIIRLDPASSHPNTSDLLSGDLVYIAEKYDGDDDMDDLLYTFGLRLMHPFGRMEQVVPLNMDTQ